MHDPFSMRPFFGYNFGDYLRHWIQLGRFSIIVSVIFIITITIITIVTLMVMMVIIKEPEEAPRSVHGELVPQGGRWWSALAWSVI